MIPLLAPLLALLFVSEANAARRVAVPPPVVVAPLPPPPPPVDPLGPMPTVGAEVPFAVPTPAAVSLSNGAGIWVLAAPSLPLVTVTLWVPGGAAVDAVGKEGTAALADRLLTQGAGKRDARAFATAVEQLGVQMDVTTGRRASTITLSFAAEKLAPALDLLADMVLRPTLTKADYAREHGLAISDLRQAQDEPVAVATKVANAAWFGPNHPYGRPPEGTVAGMSATTRKDVVAYHKATWNAAGARFTVTGAITPEQVTAALEPRLGKPWKARTAPAIVLPPVPAHDASPILLVDKPGSAQTMFYLVFSGLPIGDPGLAAARSGTIALGGTFTSRLNGLLREKLGYTYGVRAKVESFPGAGVQSIGTRIRTDVTAEGMTALVGELTRIREGISAEELTKARGAYRQDMVEAMESRAGAALTFAPYQAAGLGPAALGLELSAMAAVALDDVKSAMAAYDPAKAVVVLVGDKAVIEGPLVNAGFDKITVVPAP